MVSQIAILIVVGVGTYFSGWIATLYPFWIMWSWITRESPPQDRKIAELEARVNSLERNNLG